jgi:catechol 2,3-dioxygenase-like lactoylglutathione lyase family enzyme
MGRDPNTPEWTQHLALEVDSMEELLAAKARLEADGIKVVGPTDHTMFQSIYFFDPAAIASNWPATPARRKNGENARRGQVGHAQRMGKNEEGAGSMRAGCMTAATTLGIGLNEARNAQAGRARRHAGGGQPRSGAAVSRCLPTSARTLQAALDDWDCIAPQLAEVYEALNHGALAMPCPLIRANCHSPLPRAYQWADGSAYVNHVELVRKARGADMPPEFWTDPLMYQGGSDFRRARRDPVLARRRGLGHRLRGRSGSGHRRRADGGHTGRLPFAYPPADAGQRRQRCAT